MIPVELRTWALRHGIAEAAVADLTATLGVPTTWGGDGASESRVQSEIRLAAPSLGMRLFRNNVGVLTNEAGTPVRYGLANDSRALNQRLKSSDLIGWRRVLVTPAHVGSVVAQFVGIECKQAGWRYSGDDREQAQQRWAALVTTEGGYARFATGVQSLDV